MKKILLSVLTIFSATTMFAQSGVLNLDFENWGTTLAGPAPVGFVGLNVTQGTTGAQSGASYAHIETSGAQSGVLLNGAIVGASIKQGEAFNAKPTSVSGYIKYDIQAADTGLVVIQFTKSGALMGQAFQYVTGTNAVWTNINLPITFQGTNNPDTIYVVLASNGSLLGYGAATTGSFLDVDGFTLDPWSSVKTIEAFNGFSAYPNPASTTLNIALNKAISTGKVTFYDMTGREVMSEKINGMYNVVNIEALANGAYMYKMVDSNNQSIGNGKFIVSK